MINFHNIDCMKFMKEVPDNSYDLAIVDPPYGIDVTRMNMGGRKRNKEDKKKEWDAGVPDDKYFKELFRVSKNQIIWGGIISDSLQVNILLYGIKAKLFMGEVLLKSSTLGLVMEEQEYLKRIQTN